MIYLVVAGALALFALFYLVNRKNKEAGPKDEEEEEKEKKEEEGKTVKPVRKSSKTKPTKLKPSKPAAKEFIDSYKNFQSGVIDFDIKEHYFSVCCEDSLIRIYKINSITDTKAKYVQGTLQKNQPTAIALASNGNTVYVAGGQDLQIHPFKVEHSGAKFTLEAEKPFIKKHSIRISSLAYTPNCLVSCGEEQDTMIYIWSHSGDILTSFENKQLKHKFLVMSKDCRVFSIATWLGSARVFEFIKAKKTENYNGIHVVLELGGHSQGLSSLGFTSDGLMAVTCGLDLQVRLWNINVQFEFKEHPVLLKSIKLDNTQSAPSYCALNSKRLVLAIDNSIYVYSVPNLELVTEIREAHQHSINKIELVENTLVTCSKDTRLMLWQID